MCTPYETSNNLFPQIRVVIPYTCITNNEYVEKSTADFLFEE